MRTRWSILTNKLTSVLYFYLVHRTSTFIKFGLRRFGITFWKFKFVRNTRFGGQQFLPENMIAEKRNSQWWKFKKNNLSQCGRRNMMKLDRILRIYGSWCSRNSEPESGSDSSMAVPLISPGCSNDVFPCLPFS